MSLNKAVFERSCMSKSTYSSQPLPCLLTTHSEETEQDMGEDWAHRVTNDPKTLSYSLEGVSTKNINHKSDYYTVNFNLFH